MPITDYRNFDIFLTRSGEHDRTVPIVAPGGDTNIPINLPFDSKIQAN